MAESLRRLALLAASRTLVALVFWNSAAGQTLETQPRTFVSGLAVAPSGSGFMAMTSPMRPVPGKPFFIELESVQTQTLADGTHISRKTSLVRQFRDAMGRTRTEQQTYFPGQPEPRFEMIQIADPVARVRYMLTTRDQIARRAKIKVITGPANLTPGMGGLIQRPMGMSPVGLASGMGASGPRADVKQEWLGQQTFEGIAAEGSRMTTTMPVGYVGNDRPIETVCENWVSHELNMLVLSKCVDPRSGETTTRLTHAALSDPDPALFQVPAGYKVEKDKTPRFRMRRIRP